MFANAVSLQLTAGLSALALCVPVFLAASRRAVPDGLKELGAGLVLKALGHLLLAVLGEEAPRLAALADGVSSALFLSCLMRAIARVRQETPGWFWLGYPAGVTAAAHLLMPDASAARLVEGVVLILQGNIMLHLLIRHAGQLRGRGKYLVMAGLLMNTTLLATRGALDFRVWMEGSRAVLDQALLHSLISLGLVCLCLIVTGFILCAKEEGEERAGREADTDPLTACWNRAKILSVALGEARQLRRHGQALSLLVVDIDHFRAINDLRGTEAGDAVLRELAPRLRSALRPADELGRWGNDEFVAVLPATAADEARMVATRILEAVNARALAGLSLTVSIGVTACRQDESFYESFLRADLAAFQARSRGGDRLVVAEAGRGDRPRTGPASSASQGA